MRMRPYTGNAKIAAFGPCDNFGDGWALMDAIKYGIYDSILVAYVGSGGKLYNAHWCIIHTDCKSGRCYVNIYRQRYYFDDFMRTLRGEKNDKI